MSKQPILIPASKKRFIDEVERMLVAQIQRSSPKTKNVERRISNVLRNIFKYSEDAVGNYEFARASERFKVLVNTTFDKRKNQDLVDIFRSRLALLR